MTRTNGNGQRTDSDGPAPRRRRDHGMFDAVSTPSSETVAEPDSPVTPKQSWVERWFPTVAAWRSRRAQSAAPSAAREGESVAPTKLPPTPPLPPTPLPAPVPAGSPFTAVAPPLVAPTTTLVGKLLERAAVVLERSVESGAAIDDESLAREIIDSAVANPRDPQMQLVRELVGGVGVQRFETVPDRAVRALEQLASRPEVAPVVARIAAAAGELALLGTSCPSDAALRTGAAFFGLAARVERDPFQLARYRGKASAAVNAMIDRGVPLTRPAAGIGH